MPAYSHLYDKPTIRPSDEKRVYEDLFPIRNPTKLDECIWPEIDSGERIGRIALQQTNSRDTDAA